MKRAVQSAMRAGARGHQDSVLRKSPRRCRDCAHAKGTTKGRVPLHTLRADIDYALSAGTDHVRHDRREVLDFQRRSSG